jgi:hypothetical protein
MESAKAVNALAYTVGRDVVFGYGQYAPHSTAGRRLMAHELTHVLQQEGSDSPSLSLRDETPHDLWEGEAERFAERVISLPEEDKGAGPEVTPITKSIQRACGPKDIQSVGGPDCPALEGDILGDPFLFRLGCDTLRTDTSPPEETRLRQYIARVTPGETLEVHGFASEEGDPNFNEALSCARAVKARSILLAELARAGISATIEIYKHGATAGNRPDRRSVVIKSSAATPSPPLGLTVLPCSSLPHLIGSRGACGTGRDFSYADFPALGITDTLKVAPFRSQNDLVLLTIFTTELGALAGSTGSSMISRFSAGSGATFIHGTTSLLSILALASGTFRRALASVRTAIHSSLQAQASTGTVDCNSLAIPATAVPRIYFTFSDGSVLKAAIGGTQGLEVFVTSFSLPPGGNTYSLTLQFVICDDFGVDESDLYSPGLISFWILQHERFGYRPFVNEIIVEDTVTGTL